MAGASTRKDSVWRTASLKEWVRALKQVETEAQLEEAKSKKRSKAKGRPKRDSDYESSSSSEEEPAVRARKRSRERSRETSRKRTNHRKGKFCSYCHKIGRSEAAYKSHNEGDCTIKKARQEHENSSSADGRKQTIGQGYERQYKKQKKEIKELKRLLNPCTATVARKLVLQQEGTG